MRGGSCRGGSFYPEAPDRHRRADPPGIRPSSSVPQPRRASRPQISNRESLRLETHVNLRKQTARLDSNREDSTKIQCDAIRLGGNTCFSSHRLTRPGNAGKKSESAPLIFVSVRKKSALCFLQLTEILIEPLFRLDSAKFARPQPSLLGGLADRKEVS